MRKRVNFVVTDLDDTIWDWLTMWYSSFNPFLERISSELKIDKSELKKDFKQLHQKFHTSESSFIIEHLQLLTSEQREKIRLDSPDGKGIMHEYNSNKKKSLNLYEGVREALTLIKNSGAMIIGFTESHSFYTKYRIKTLELDGLFDCIYAPIDAALPDTFKKFYPDGYWESEKTEFRYLARSVKKPNAEILEIILKDFEAKKLNTIYIGDKLDRDIFMAQEAGITSVYAKYGHKIVGEEYDLLKEVTHWTDEDVQREIDFKAGFSDRKVKPDLTLESSFIEIIKLFEFFPFERPDNRGNIREDKKELTKNVIEVWKKTIEVQQHFNDLELRIRNYALTLFTATVAGVGLVEREKIEFDFWGFLVPASAILSLVGLLVLTAFWYMDRWWYHNLLMGAVNHGRKIEDKYVHQFPELGLTNAIGESSPYLSYWTGKKVHSPAKFRIFYRLMGIPLALLTFVLIVGHQKTPEFQKRKPSLKNSEPVKSDNSKDKGGIKIIVPSDTGKR
jgi:phosphoglycolate phosphatase-like HAD superfamily hydrolase